MAQFAQVSNALGIIGQTYASLSAGKAAQNAGARTAASEIQSANYAANLERVKGSQIISQEQAVTAGAGLALKGSPLDVMMNSAFNSEQNAQAILYGGKVRAQQALTTGALANRSLAFQSAGRGLTATGSAIGNWWENYGQDFWKTSASAPMADSPWASSTPTGRFTIK